MNQELMEFIIVDNQKRIKEIKSRLTKATPAPWYVNFLDDSLFMNLVAVTTKPDNGKHEALCDETTLEIRESIIATTLLQADITEGKPFVEVQLEDDDDTDSAGYREYNNWDEDAEFIAHAREDIPWLLAQIEKLQNRLGTFRFVTTMLPYEN